MNVATPEPTAMHRAALSLHALGEADRAWVLQGLPADQQAALQRMLDELQAIGVARDARLFDGLLQRPGTAIAPPGLREADAQAISLLLQGEPARIVAALLAPGDLPWLAHALPDGEGRPAQTPPPGVALQAAVRAEVERLVADRRPGSAPASMWARVQQTFRFRGRRP